MTNACIPAAEEKSYGPWAQPNLSLGCATEQNLSAMIADPDDLQRGSSIGPADTAFMTNAIDRYRKNLTTPLAKESGKDQEK
ncbi:hypothetical protein CCP2SC5_140006 [Azospirillaceae bacterium]